MNQNNFIEELKKINIELNDEQIKQLEKYYELLVEWNNKFNLTNITDKEQVYLKHFYDSITLSTVSKELVNLKENLSLCDVGTGAGFPGLVLKIVYPNLEVTLVDSLNKRINFLNEVINKLNLKGIKTVHARAEDFAKNNIEKFDILTSRAVAHLSILLEYCIPMTKINGFLLAMKSNVEEEIIESNEALKILSSKIVEKKELYLPYENSFRTILVIKKIEKTNKKYPRKAGEIKKKRL